MSNILYGIYVSALFLFIFMGGGWLGSALIAQLGIANYFASSNAFLFTGQLVIYALLIAGFALAAHGLFRKKSLRDVFGLRAPSSYRYFLAVPLLFIVYALLSGILTQLIARIVGGFDLNETQDTGFNFVGIDERILAGVVLVVIVPFFEEAFFRGWLYGFLRSKLGFLWTSFIVSVIFGYLHGQWNVGVDVFILSLALCWLREKTGSIWAGVSLHMLKNLIAFIFIALGVV